MEINPLRNTMKAVPSLSPSRMCASLVAICMAGWSSGASAQNRPNDIVMDDSGLQIETSANAVYDSNIYRTDSKKVAPVDDFILSPTIEARYNRDISRNMLSVSLLGGYDFFVSQTTRSKPRVAAKLYGTVAVSKLCQIEPELSYRRERADYGDLNQAAENLQQFSRIGAIASCPRDAGFYPEIGYLRTTTKNDTLFNYADQRTNSFSGAVGYARPSLGSVKLFYSHDNVYRPNLNFTNKVDFVGVVFERAVSPLFYIKADVRGIRLRSSSGAVGNYNGVGWNVIATTRAIPRLSFSLATERKVQNDSLISSGFAIEARYTAIARVAVSALTSVEATVELRHRDFHQDQSRVGIQIDSDNNYFGGITARRKLTNRFELSVEASRYQRRTNNQLADFNATRLLLGAKARF
ncbi:hypothetical protein BH09PSE3_BH09PSE3_03920 [soil metagenome]